MCEPNTSCVKAQHAHKMGGEVLLLLSVPVVVLPGDLPLIVHLFVSTVGLWFVHQIRV